MRVSVQERNDSMVFVSKAYMALKFSLQPHHAKKNQTEIQLENNEKRRRRSLLFALAFIVNKVNIGMSKT